MSYTKGPHKYFGHVAVRLGDGILVLGGRFHHNNNGNHTLVSHHMIWMYNLCTEQWSKHMIPESEICPSDTADACAVAIKDHVFLFGGYCLSRDTGSNEIWKLSKSSEGLFSWRKVITENMKVPSPRACHSGWTYSEKLYIFGGLGLSTDEYLNDHDEFVQHPDINIGYNNQLLCFNPSGKEWVNLNHSGSIPSPRAGHASTIVRDSVWLYGGRCPSIKFDELYELSMCSLHWTQVQTGRTKPQGRILCSLNTISTDQLLLHGGNGSDERALSDTWILDLPSLSWKQ